MKTLADNELRILFLGDIVGEPGRKAVIRNLAAIRAAYSVDFIIVNGENAAAGRGITPKISIDLLRAGATVITTGDHAWDQKEILEYFPTEPRLLRPVNYPNGAPGAGSVILDSKKGKVAVVQVQARTFTRPELDNPFVCLSEEVERLREETRIIFVDVHGETTSEKIALGRAFDGAVSAVVGTHTHVQTNDARIFPGGTAFLCDAGMCGAVESILGREIQSVIYQFRTCLPTRLPVAKGRVRLCGALVDIDTDTGWATAIESFSRTCDLEGQLEP